MDNEQALKDSIFRIGKVVSVDGRTVKVTVDKKKNSSNLLFKGEVVKNISVGGFIKIVKGFITIIGKVEGEFITEDKFSIKKEYRSNKDNINRILVISLLGFFNGSKFERGIKELPLIDNECFLLDKDEFDLVHNFVKKDDEPIILGNLTLEKGHPIKVGVNSLFASHIGIFGNTGSGKSYTLAKILREVMIKFVGQKKFIENSKFVLIDFNGEYIKEKNIVDKQNKIIIELSTRISKDKFPINEKIVKESMFWSVLLEATEKTQAPFIKRAISSKQIKKSLVNESGIKTLIKNVLNSVTTQADKSFDKLFINNFLWEINNCLDTKISKFGEIIFDYENYLQWHSNQNKYIYTEPGKATIYSGTADFKDNVIDAKIDSIIINYSTVSELEKLYLQILFKYYDEILKGYSNKEHIGPLVGRLPKRMKELEKIIEIVPGNLFKNGNPNFAVISLKDVNIHMKKILPLLISKQLYDDKKESNIEGTSLHLIIDEAHNILSHISERESETWKDYRLETFEEIIKEGRKFGVFLTIASQRPADISPTIISQLHNYFLHRLINNNDIHAVEKAILYLDKVSFDYLPILPTGSCILAGLSAEVPVVIEIGKIEDEYEPYNKTIELLKYWKD